MDKTIMKFGDNETKKQKLHQHKRPNFFFLYQHLHIKQKNLHSPGLHTYAGI